MFIERIETKLNECYLASVQRFVAFGLTPPPSLVQDGNLPVNEALPWLVDLHDSCITALANDDARVLPKALRRLGHQRVASILLRSLADYYGITEVDLFQALALQDDSSTEGEINPNLQPLLANGSVDATLLAAECDELLGHYDGPSPVVTIEAYAGASDPRRHLQLSRIAITSHGIAWVNWYRPHHSEQILFEAVRLIHRTDGNSPRWHVVFDQWLRRSFADRPDSTENEWDSAMPKVREFSTNAGLEWRLQIEGSRP